MALAPAVLASVITAGATVGAAAYNARQQARVRPPKPQQPEKPPVMPAPARASTSVGAYGRLSPDSGTLLAGPSLGKSTLLGE